MANQLGTTPSAYSKIERGETKIDTNRLKQLFEVLEISIMDLLGDESIIVAHNGDCSVNGYNDIESYHTGETQAKIREPMIEYMERGIASLLQESDSLFSLVEELTQNNS
ncbi:MAG: helix-turn-helix transcriptional regulator [Bacteroidota bacterium]